MATKTAKAPAEIVDRYFIGLPIDCGLVVQHMPEDLASRVAKFHKDVDQLERDLVKLFAARHAMLEGAPGTMLKDLFEGAKALEERRAECGERSMKLHDERNALQTELLPCYRLGVDDAKRTLEEVEKRIVSDAAEEGVTPEKIYPADPSMGERMIINQNYQRGDYLDARLAVDAAEARVGAARELPQFQRDDVAVRWPETAHLQVAQMFGLV